MRQLACLLLCALALGVRANMSRAQGGLSTTPLPAVLITATPAGRSLAAPTVTASFTPTEIPAARLQALVSAGDVNVRARPDISSEILGAITYGTEYRALRQYYRWYELAFTLSPSGRAWVYGDLVEITGNQALIEVVEDPNLIAGVNTVTERLATAEQDSRVIELATIEAGGSSQVIAATALPTFTSPPPTQARFADHLERDQRDGGALGSLPPIAPILALGALGALGMLISLLRG